MSPFAELEIVRCRVILGIGAHRLSRAAGRAGSTIAKVLKRRGLHKLNPLPPREPVVRYEHATPGAMLHVDIKELVRFEQVGHRIHGDRTRMTRRVGTEAVHVAIDDHSRFSYVEVLADQKTDTCVGFITRAQAFYAAHGITIDRVLTDNGTGYKLKWSTALAGLGMRAKHTRPYRPQTNGKAERFIQTMLREWALRRTTEPRLTVRVDEANDVTRCFWGGLGFALAQRYSVLRIDLTAPRAEPSSAAFHVVSLADRPDLMRAAWQVQGDSWKDVPGNEQAMPPFERWSTSFSSGVRPPEGAFIALDESGDVLGLTTTSVTVGDMRIALTSYTGARPDARCRGVALALKRRQVEWCRDAGYGVIETVNHQDNAAVLAINEKLGFVPYCAVLALEHTLR